MAAVLAEMRCKVYTIEIVPELGMRSKKLLKELGYNKNGRLTSQYQYPVRFVP